MTDVPSTLRSIVQTYGDMVVQEPKRVEGLLRDLRGGRTREINLILLALRENVAADLTVPQTGNFPRELLLARLKTRLEDNHGTSSEAAHWAVDAWDFALGFRAEAVSLGASQVKSNTATKPDVARQAIMPQEKAAASAALLALLTDADGNLDAAKAQAVTVAQVQQLLDQGADVNAKNDDGHTALMTAVLNGHSNCVQALIAHGADVNAKNNGCTALTLAAEKGHSDCVKVLKSAGAKG